MAHVVTPRHEPWPSAHSLAANAALALRRPQMPAPWWQQRCKGLTGNGLIRSCRLWKRMWKGGCYGAGGEGIRCIQPESQPLAGECALTQPSAKARIRKAKALRTVDVSFPFCSMCVKYVFVKWSQMRSSTRVMSPSMSPL